MFGLRNMQNVFGFKLKWWQTLYWWLFIAIRYPFSKDLRRETKFWKIMYKNKFHK